MPELEIEDGDDDVFTSDRRYNIDFVLSERPTQSPGKKGRDYLIRWEGNYEDSWEHEDNVGQGVALRAYRAAKRHSDLQNTS